MAGGGVGEAMLIGAAVGAGTGGIMSAAQDKDPLEGALLGAAMGAAGGGIGSAVGGVASGAATGATGGAAGGTTGGVTGGTVGGEVGGTVGGASGVAGEATSQLGQQALQNAATTQGFTIPQGYQLGTGTLGNQVAASQGFEPLATGTGFTEDVITKAAAPQSWGQQGIGQGFAPALTNAQAYGAGAGGGIMGLIGNAQNQGEQWAPEQDPYTGSLSYFKYNPQTFKPSTAPGYADGGVASLQPTAMYPQSQLDTTQFAVPSQQPTSREVVSADYDTRINPYTGEMMMAGGGISSLGSYSDGGRMLRGPGDGMSDDIPGVIAGKQPARLADGEFVVPADVVSHLGNGSTDAGAKKLYSMMDNVRKARTGSKKQGKQIKAEKHMPGMKDGGIARFYDGGSTDEEAPAWFSNWLASQEAAPRPGMGAVSPSFQPTGYTPSQQYSPYTISGRPSSTEPQFYGNIYQPTYENFASPAYDMNAGLGRWNNIANTRFDEQLYLQQKMQQLQDIGYQGPYHGTTGAELKDYIASQGMTLPQHYERYGKAEGLNPYATQATQAPSLAQDLEASKQEASKEQKKRSGGIASLV